MGLTEGGVKDESQTSGLSDRVESHANDQIGKLGQKHGVKGLASGAGSRR